ncbi:MAG: superoxide dismutase [Cu-Zn] SodC [Alcaligenes sp.]
MRFSSVYAKFALVAATAGTSLALAAPALADVTIPMKMATKDGVGDTIGQVTVSQTQYGLVFTPDLQKLQAGVHGFHVHETPSCEPSEKDGKITPAGAAGGHLDPEKTGKHDFPWGNGHLGDLPGLYVNADGSASTPILAPRLTSLDQIKGHALMIHEGGDNHSDHPAPLGGGAGRIACGVIQ